MSHFKVTWLTQFIITPFITGKTAECTIQAKQQH